MPFLRLRSLWLALAVGAALAGCAPSVVTAPASIDLAASSDSRPIRLKAPADVKLDTGYSRQLAAGSTWRPAGRIPAGTVYRPVGTIFTIEGRQVHEAYLVVRERTLVGFYLPGELSYSPLTTAVPLTIGEVE